jgi:hypothetical protein
MGGLRGMRAGFRNDDIGRLEYTPTLSGEFTNDFTTTTLQHPGACARAVRYG